jgi:hypothetical protein
MHYILLIAFILHSVLLFNPPLLNLNFEVTLGAKIGRVNEPYNDTTASINLNPIPLWQGFVLK